MKLLRHLILFGFFPFLSVNAEETYNFVQPDIKDLATALGFSVFNKLKIEGITDDYSPKLSVFTQRKDGTEEKTWEGSLAASDRKSDTYLIFSVIRDELTFNVGGVATTYKSDFFNLDPHSLFVSLGRAKLTDRGLVLFSAGNNKDEKITFYFESR